MFTARLNKLNDQLTYSERLISNMLLERYRNFEMMTSDQIAREVGCGQATVIRYSRKLGYPTFKSMMLDIANDSAFYGNSKLSEEEPLHDMMSKMKNLYDISVADAFTSNKVEEIEAAAEYLQNAGTIFCYGIRSSYALVLTMYYRLLESGRSVLTTEDLLEGVSIIRHLNEKDVLLVVSISGETRETVKAVEEAHAKGVKIISITGSGKNTIQTLSDIALKSTEYNMHTNRVNLVNRASVLFLLDCLFTRLWRNNEEELIKSCEAMSSITTNGPVLDVNGEVDSFRL